jgi:hypothetical protein
MAPLIVILAACGTTIQSSGGVAPGRVVPANARVLIMALADAVDKGGTTIGGSGGATTAAIRDALVAHGYAPIVGDSKTLADAFLESEKLG